MKQLIMTTPTKFGVQYEINPHMNGNVDGIDLFRAVQQWSDLRNALALVGADVIVTPEPPAECPDAVFTSGAGLIYDGEFICSRFKYAERRDEEEYFFEWFASHGFTVRGSFYDSSIAPNMTFEGASDALFSHDRRNLWYGMGFRSSFAYKKKLDEFFDRHEQTIVRPLILVDRRFFNLDTCFCPLDTGELLWYPDAFDSHAQMVIESFYRDKMITVHEQDAMRFACNAVSVGDNIVLPEVSDFLAAQLEHRGYNVVQVQMSEFIKSGGACKSLTLEVIE